MSVICVRDNTSNRWKRNAKKKSKTKQDTKKQKKKQTKAEKNKGYGSYSERVRAKWFCCAFKLAL